VASILHRRICRRHARATGRGTDSREDENLPLVEAGSWWGSLSSWSGRQTSTSGIRDSSH
jgi:hypothetical protein